MDEYKPQIISSGEDGAYAIMLVHLKKCPICSKWMFNGFPAYHKLDIRTQLKLAGWVHSSKTTIGFNKTICVECEKADKATFQCVLCKEQRKSSEIEESIGDPAEHLCANCYASVPAKTWYEKVDELEDKHKYDYE